MLIDQPSMGQAIVSVDEKQEAIRGVLGVSD